MKKGRIFLLLLLLPSAVAAAETAVEIDGELLHGRLHDDSGIKAFLGVPFAQPPVGDLRWRAPQPYKPTSESRSAVAFGSACMQTMRILDWYRDMAELTGAERSVMQDLDINEDCLYLNIWTPTLQQGADLPVMVYVHGGSNRSGWSYEPNYHGQVLAAQGVVVISVAYRLGDFGFFAHPELTDQAAVTNFGLWDIVAALEWVRENVASFGGDNSRVTVFGESSGAQNIVALMNSSRADDLFDRAILQSTAGFSRPSQPTLQDERRRGLQLAETLGTDSALSVEDLRDIPADTFLALSETNRGTHYHSPVAGGRLLDRGANRNTDASSIKARPVIVGTNLNESYSGFPADADDSYLQEIAAALFGNQAADALAIVRSESETRAAADRLRTGARFLCPSQQYAESLVGNGSPVWMYRFSRVREDVIGAANGAYHGAELPYVFGTHDPWMNTTDADLQITADTMSYWLSFAKTGNPNGDATNYWPRFQSPDYRVLDIDAPLQSIAAPDAELCALYNSQ